MYHIFALTFTLNFTFNLFNHKHTTQNSKTSVLQEPNNTASIDPS